MHLGKWTEYCDLDAGVQKSFFGVSSGSRRQAAMHAYVGTNNTPLCALINTDIVKVIIGDMMFHPEYMDSFS